MRTHLLPTLDRPAGGAGKPWERHNSFATGSYGCTSCVVRGRKRGESAPRAPRARRSRAPGRSRCAAAVGGKRGQRARRGFARRAPSSAAAAGSWADPALPRRRHQPLPPRAPARRTMCVATKCRRQRSRASFAVPRAPPRAAPSAAGGAACVRRASLSAAKRRERARVHSQVREQQRQSPAQQERRRGGGAAQPSGRTAATQVPPGAPLPRCVSGANEETRLGAPHFSR